MEITKEITMRKEDYITAYSSTLIVLAAYLVTMQIHFENSSMALLTVAAVIAAIISI
jgi:hypothetical protein